MALAQQVRPADDTSARIGLSGYGSRAFDSVPDTRTAGELLRGIDAAQCRFSPAAVQPPLVLYGGGDLGRLARDYCSGLGLEVAALVDRNAERLRQDAFWQGLPVFAPDEVAKDLKATAQLAVCVATAPFLPLAETLARDGWGNVVPFYDVAESLRAVHPLSNGWFVGAFSPQDMEETARVLFGWEDDVSRAHHLQFIAWRRLREEWTFEDAPVRGDDRFFIPEIMAHIGGVRMFVDGGSYDGRVTDRFLANTKSNDAHVVAIEPDLENSAAHRQGLLAKPDDISGRVTILNEALDATKRERLFHGGLGYASQLSQTGNRLLRTATIDGLNLSPDFLKLHLEGGELDALKGGMETINRCRPIIAATIYHNDDGIWRTPSWLMSELRGYRFLMRLHSWCGTGAVVYALPEELQ
ncbi:FkbM family methyltransferase [Ciceribacter sp. L1K22]|uniref:FkbM family methyltransferase n=1 Tax=Ciceribacter sp. L1K22 TaxID=2820275 RepID=UPI001ABE0AA1|nr:FkbM family methyltransferase [Ciceribacter sp. L1K22]MBO3762256.1 FkbM family methyltransferase [Ciceribacter sp. L1K22]